MRLTRYRTLPGRRPRFAVMIQVKLGDRMIVFETKARRLPLPEVTPRPYSDTPVARSSQP